LSNSRIRNILNVGVVTFKQASNQPGRRRTRPGSNNYHKTSNSIIIFISFGGLFNNSPATTSNSYLKLKSPTKTLQVKKKEVKNRIRITKTQKNSEEITTYLRRRMSSIILFNTSRHHRDPTQNTPQAFKNDLLRQLDIRNKSGRI